MKVPKVCGRCASPINNKEFAIGEKIRITDKISINQMLGNPPKLNTARVILLIDESECLQKVLMEKAKNDNPVIIQLVRSVVQFHKEKGNFMPIKLLRS